MIASLRGRRGGTGVRLRRKLESVPYFRDGSFLRENYIARQGFANFPNTTHQCACICRRCLNDGCALLTHPMRMDKVFDMPALVLDLGQNCDLLPLSCWQAI
jgi:hypothetical protein